MGFDNDAEICEHCKGEYCRSCGFSHHGGGNPTAERSRLGLPFRGNARAGSELGRLGFYGSSSRKKL